MFWKQHLWNHDEFMWTSEQHRTSWHWCFWQNHLFRKLFSSTQEGFGLRRFNLGNTQALYDQTRITPVKFRATPSPYLLVVKATDPWFIGLVLFLCLTSFSSFKKFSQRTHAQPAKIAVKIIASLKRKITQQWTAPNNPQGKNILLCFNMMCLHDLLLFFVHSVLTKSICHTYFPPLLLLRMKMS